MFCPVSLFPRLLPAFLAYFFNFFNSNQKRCESIIKKQIKCSGFIKILAADEERRGNIHANSMKVLPVSNLGRYFDQKMIKITLLSSFV